VFCVGVSLPWSVRVRNLSRTARLVDRVGADFRAVRREPNKGTLLAIECDELG